MANVPSQAEVERAILDVISTLNVRANEIFNVMTVHLRLQKNGLRANEINAAFASLGQRGLFEAASSSKFLKLTQAGFGEL
jgi:hypothetical protein